MTLTVHQFPCLSDNYGYLVRDDATGRTACIDTPDAAAILGELQALGWTLDLVLNTHWHADHAGGGEKEDDVLVFAGRNVTFHALSFCDGLHYGG